MEESYLETINKRKQIETANIRKCNEYTNKYGLVLSDNQINNLLERRIETLKETGRIELREGIIDKLIKEFCDSPYINQEIYAETLYELIEIFYEYKNETNEQLEKHIDKNLDYIAEIIINAVEQNTLDKVFITQKFIESC